MRYARITLIIFLFSSFLFAQKVDLNKISGTVINKETDEPIPYVNVFLDATTLGASTNNIGEYSIVGIPTGSYKIIASAIGFEKQTKNILINSTKTIKIDFILKPVIYKLNEVSIVAEEDDEWAKNMRLFKKEFLGTSTFSSKCTIVNPHVITFSKDKKIKLKADATEPIEIINKALGYKVFFEIKDFELYQNREFNYFGNIRFVELETKDEDESNLWQKNRESAYKGSFRHFLVSLLNNSLLKNDFQIFMVNEPNWDNLRRRNFTIPAISTIVKSISHFENELTFYSNLMVVYNDWEDVGFQKYRNRMGSNIFRPMNFQTSWLKLPFSTATFDINGNIMDDYRSTKFFGYWAWQRVANLLPNNYHPK